MPKVTSLRLKVTSHGAHVTIIGLIWASCVFSPRLGYLRSFDSYHGPPVSLSEPPDGHIKSLESHFEAL